MSNLTGASPPAGNKDDWMRRWDYMHFSLALAVVLVAAFLLGIFAIRGDVQGMSTTAGIVSGWVGAVIGWFFTKTAKTSPPPGSGGPNPPSIPTGGSQPPAPSG